MDRQTRPRSRNAKRLHLEGGAVCALRRLRGLIPFLRNKVNDFDIIPSVASGDSSPCNKGSLLGFRKPGMRIATEVEVGYWFAMTYLVGLCESSGTVKTVPYGDF